MSKTITTYSIKILCAVIRVESGTRTWQFLQSVILLDGQPFEHLQRSFETLGAEGAVARQAREVGDKIKWLQATRLKEESWRMVNYEIRNASVRDEQGKEIPHEGFSAPALAKFREIVEQKLAA